MNIEDEELMDVAVREKHRIARKQNNKPSTHQQKQKQKSDPFPESELLDITKISEQNLRNFNIKITAPGAICDECGESINGARWICLFCKPGAVLTGGLVDFCTVCYKRLMESR